MTSPLRFPAARLPFLPQFSSAFNGVASLTTNANTECSTSTGEGIEPGRDPPCGRDFPGCKPTSKDVNIENRYDPAFKFYCDQHAYERVPLNSIMFSLTTHTARPCLGQDDLDGLNHLYPSCENARIKDPVCIKSKRNIGYVRVGLCAFTLCCPNSVAPIPRRSQVSPKLTCVHSRGQELLDTLHFGGGPVPNALPLVVPKAFAQGDPEKVEAGR